VIIDRGSSALLVDLIDTGIIQSLVVDGNDEGIVVTGSGRHAWNGVSPPSVDEVHAAWHNRRLTRP